MSALFLPEAASTYAADVDWLFLAMTLLTGAVAVAIIILLLAFSLKFRRGSGANRRRTPLARRQRVRRRIEIAWIAIPMLFFVAAFIWGAALYFDRSVPPSGALEVAVVAKQWMWRVEHANGAREINELHVPVNLPIKLVMTSQDVIHSFYAPAFRVKQDVLPGRYTVLWFNAIKTGDYALDCAEYCGTEHARMLGHIIVLEQPAYQRWLESQSAGPNMATRGEALFRELGCSGCHGERATVHAPPLEGLFGRRVPLTGGALVVANERYIRDSILLPASEIAAGYEPIMPTFAGQVSEVDLLELIAYIKSLAGREPSK